MSDLATSIARNEVHYCVSHLIQTLANCESPDLDLEQLLALQWREPNADDYREAYQYLHKGAALAVEPGRTGDEADQSSGDWYLAVMDDDGEVMADGYYATEVEAWRAGFDELGHDHPDGLEVYEYWLVSDWLADKLEARGESVARDLAGLTVWGRCTTGQAISMDSVIQDIAREVAAA